MDKKKGLTLSGKHNLIGWLFLLPASLMIFWMCFYPIVRGFILSLYSGKTPATMIFVGFRNYARIFNDANFLLTIRNTFIYLIVQVPVMLLLAIILASMLNSKDLKLKGIFRTAIFLPCAVSLVAYSIIFRSLFATDGLINHILISAGIFTENYNWLNNGLTAKIVIIVALLWRWTGYNMIFFLSALQNIDYSIYEAARIDGAGAFSQFTRITAPLLKPMILLTAIMSTNGTLQLFDESFNLTRGGPGKETMTMSHYIYETAFQKSPNLPYASTISYVILIMVAVIAVLQIKVGDKR
ncbi:MAG: sugar ABC transporter permease [Clostridiales bacterium]|jgi:lactose/L-arabinose transport system permease protein|nr:sugar ABC transporter permease [Clostridiales bacterium]